METHSSCTPSVWRAEKEHLQAWQQHFEYSADQAQHQAHASSICAHHGNYDDQEAQFIYGEHAADLRKARDAALRKQMYRNKPYYGRVNAKTGETEQRFYLSDEAMQQDIELMDSSGTDVIIPFVHNHSEGLIAAIIQCYSSKDPSSIRYNSHPLHGEPVERLSYQVDAIRAVDIIRGELKDVEEIYPKVVDADELLAHRLEQDRSGGPLKSIIATIQKEQFEIIRQEADASFVVQGCAGSGKTQILLHRLFYLRSVLSDHHWEDVMILTPSHLLRSFSAEMMRRFQLSRVTQQSVAELYRHLLNCYDERFRTRQYVFALTEEYLPDEYLQEAYAPQTFAAVSSAMRLAIRSRLSEASRLTGVAVPMPREAKQAIIEMLAQIDHRLTILDEQEKRIQDEEWQQHREALEMIHKRRLTLETAKKQTEDAIRVQHERMQQIERVGNELAHDRLEAKNWKKEHEAAVAQSNQAIAQAVAAIDHAQTDKSMIPLLRAYVDAVVVYRSLTDPNSEQMREYEEMRQLHEQIVAESERDHQALTGGLSEADWRKRAEHQEQALKLRAERNEQSLLENMEAAKVHEDWMKQFEEKSGETARSSKTANCAELERMRYQLSRFESSVFETEVWNTLAPLKQKYGIEIEYVEEKNGHKQTSRVLHKIDLMHYLSIYMELYGESGIIPCRVLCIDEGQDLHAIDYAMLHRFFPQTPFNIFGDQAQVLHDRCGVHDWKEDTGVATVFEMKRNYRNPTQIVQFCQRHFHCQMEGIGVQGQAVQVVRGDDFKRIRAALIKTPDTRIIVHDRAIYETLCLALAPLPQPLEYIDAATEKINGNAAEVYSIHAAKGMEFQHVIVCAHGMNENQKLVACTRAMDNLIYLEGGNLG